MTAFAATDNDSARNLIAAHEATLRQPDLPAGQAAAVMLRADQ